MARPIVVVLQELAQVSATPATPDLNSVYIGECYTIKDYPDDQAEILLDATYGRLNDPAGGTSQYTPPVSGSDAVTVVSYPANAPGALVDHASVVFTLRFPRVCMGATYSGCGTVFGTTAQTFNTVGNENKVTVSSADFVAAGLKPGDTVILTSSDFTQTVVRTILSVGEPDALGAPTDVHSFRLTANLPTPSAKSVGSITAVGGASILDGETFTLDDGVHTATVFEFDSNAAVTPGHIAVTFTNGDSAATVAAAIRAAINGVGAGLTITAAAPVGAVVGLTNDAYGAYNAAITETVSNVGFSVTGMSGGAHSTATWIYDSNGEIRVERVLPTQTLLDPSDVFVTFPDYGTDKCVLKGGVTLPVAVNGVTVQKPLSYAQLYLAYRALRQDLTDVGSVTASDVVVSGGFSRFAALGKIDARNPLAAALALGLKNAGSAPLYYRAVASNNADGHLAARAALSSRRDLYTFVPLTQDVDTLAAYKFEWENLASPDFAIENGVPQLFRIVLGNVPLPTASVLGTPSIIGAAAQQAGTSSGRFRTLNISGTPTIDLSLILPNDVVTIGLVPAGGQWASRRGVHKVAHVNSTTQLEIEPGSARWNDGVTDAPGAMEIRIVSGTTGAVKLSKLASVEILDAGNGVHFESLAPTTAGGPYRVRYVNAGTTVPTVSISGFDVTVNLNPTVTTYQQVIDAVNAHSVVNTVMAATLVGSNGAVSAAIGFQSLTVASLLCTGEVVVNDDLYLRLSDSGATFVTSGVKPGDVLEFPVNPNSYAPTAFDGQLLSYLVAQVISENLLLVQNLSDDKPGVATELPHLYARDVAGELLDNDPTGSPAAALNYRIRRLLSADDQVMALIAVSSSFRSKRVTLTWPDQVDVSGLVDGSLPRAVASVPTVSTKHPGYMVCAQVAGALAGLPVQQGLTNIGLAGIRKLHHSSGYFTEPQLSKLSDGGWFVLHQPVPEALPFCLHQLTTDVTALETGELSVVRNVDYVSIFLQTTLQGFLGRYNVLPETMDDILTSMNSATENLKTGKIANIGPKLVEGEVTSIRVSDTNADRIVLYFTGSVPIPLNRVDLHVVI